MTTSPDSSRNLSGAGLKQALRQARARTWELVDDLTEAQWRPALQDGVNPIAWELAHLAWFAEFWILRGPHGRSKDGFATASRAPQVAGPDAHFDSARLSHAQRWTTPMPSRSELKSRLQDQLDACLDAIPQTLASSVGDDEALYFHRLALFHEDMHAEALCWTRAALGYPAPRGAAWPGSQAGGSTGIQPGRPADGAPSRQIAHAGGAFELGIGPRASGFAPGFAFDNEGPGRPVKLAPFSIDSTPVSAAEFACFVDAGGYSHADWWPGEAGRWRAASGANHPAHWRRSSSGNWQMRWFDGFVPLQSQAPVIHVNAFEAEAYCLWAGRRLPSAAEWECAALTADTMGSGFSWGRSVWEWTSDWFNAYPGFTAGPYREYSQPWFGDHRELRGGAFATHARMHNPRYRNFFLPSRSDIFAGFRTASH